MDATVVSQGRWGMPHTDEARRELLAELSSARRLYETFDPDSPPWAIEPELRRLERLLADADDAGLRRQARR